ncbi:hypothetical protein ACOSP7_019788 [Xanthoceras sorbifolium]
MVFSCVREEGESMAMAPERSSKPLHNFTLPCTLKWGHQRHLRCMKVQDLSTTSAAAVDHRPVRRRTSPSRLSGFSEASRRGERVLMFQTTRTDGGVVRGREEEEEEEGIEAVREKIMNDLKTAADQMKDAILREETVSDYEREEEEEFPVSAAPAAAAAAAAAQDTVRPWNLRTRRAACKAPLGGPAAASSPASKGLLKIEERKPSSSSSPMRSEVVVGAKSPRVLRGAEKEVKKERPKFSVALTKKEIEEDFMELLNHRPPRRPKKRPRPVQKQLDSLFPGLWLTEVTPDSYKVPELPENGKR